jgi:general secretion pathway protein I
MNHNRQPVSGKKSVLSAGFTLIEIMVALAVVAIGLLATSEALTRNVNLATQLEMRTIANWVGSNRMAELRMNRDFTASGSSSSQQQMAGRDWRVVDNFYGTADPDIVRVEVEVFDETVASSVSTNIGYISRYKAPKR